ncbi:putative zinc finger protein [Danaus plexippus plexippus]|uniref:Zinc finger protein n=1 Tax=Danaus plexippus plexippus TaxID=278856 RepID=A0A212EMU3_DANPL|nr:putative zinc finger protein [Danaus plexippus plexippus]
MEATFDKFKGIKTYSRVNNVKSNNQTVTVNSTDKKVPLTTKNAVKFLLEGTLRLKVCRYCLSVTTSLSELDEILVIAVNSALHEVTIRDMVASFHPFKVTDDKNFPNKICSDCLNRTMNCYLFAQQCERSERSLRNCFEDMYDKFEKLDPIEPVKRRGKPKLNPNCNILYTEHNEVMNYAEPIINIINTDTVAIEDNFITELECQKCWQVLPTAESLLNHEKIHPKSMWYNCRLCGKSFVKRCHLKKHLKSHRQLSNSDNTESSYKCNDCGISSDTLSDHYQHIEKHKFKDMFEHLIEGNIGSFCAICMDKGLKMVELSEMVHLHGGYPALSRDLTIQNVLTATIPGIQLDSYMGNKICDSCVNHALNTYIFISKVQYVRNRLNTSVTLMLDNLNIDDPESNVMVEISKELILPSVKDADDTDDSDESDYKVEVLEDEFRVEYSESGSESDFKEDSIVLSNDIQDQLKNVTKTYSKKVFNGFQMKNDEDSLDVCSEFLTFKKRVKTRKRAPKIRYTCPFCNKNFISDYFLKKHALKHINRAVECDLCYDQFKSKFHLFEHKKMMHLLQSQNYMTCNICGRTFESANKMKIHQKCHRYKECHLCNKYFISQKYYDIHMQRHAARFNTYRNRDEQTCSFCEKACSNENELSLHVNKVHLQIKPYSCDMCEKQYYTEYNLLSHKKLHSLPCKEICEFCNRVFKCRKNLVIHVRKHIGIKPHNCPVCRQAFYSDSIMKNHMKNYHGGKFCCRLCRTVLQSQFDLKTHINVAHSSM